MAKRSRGDSVASKTDDDVVVASSAERSNHASKYASLEPEEQPSTTMRCLLPPHKPLEFSSYTDYESHYQNAHTNRCTECQKNFPTSHMLDLHIAEQHDPIVDSKREAGEKTYACFVEGCEKICRDWKKRRSHLVDKHGYPKNYDFLVVDHGIDGRRSMLRPGIDGQGHRKSSRERHRSDSSVSTATQTTTATSVSEQSSTQSVEKAETKDDTTEPQPASEDGSKGVDDLTTSMSALRMVPRNVKFGKRSGRSGLAKS